MAHIYAYGVDAPGAKGIIHLGATSCYVTDNADLILYRDGAAVPREASWRPAMRNLCDFADRYAALPCARPIRTISPRSWSTVGKRATLWLQDLMLDLEELQRRARGPSASSAAAARPARRQASCRAVSTATRAKIDEMNRKIAAELRL